MVVCTCEDPKILQAEVIVLGAGPAGLAAAVSAAKEGVHTLLIEKESFIGGTITKAKLACFCGLYYPDEARPRLALSAEACKWIEGLGGPPVKKGRFFVLPVEPKVFEKRAWENIRQYKNLKVITRFTLKDKILKAKAFIDCTGLAVLAAPLGLKPIKYHSMVPGLGFKIVGGQKSRLGPGALEVSHFVIRNFPKISLKLYPEFTAQENEIVGILNFDVSMKIRSKKAKALLQEVWEAIKKQFSALRYARIVWAGDLVDRGGQGIPGKTTFSMDPNVKEGIRIWWPAECWFDPYGAVFKAWDKLGARLPDDCLRARTNWPVFMAGKSISATLEGFCAARVVGPCLETGTRAGYLAAKEAERGDYHELVFQ